MKFITNFLLFSCTTTLFYRTVIYAKEISIERKREICGITEIYSRDRNLTPIPEGLTENYSYDKGFSLMPEEEIKNYSCEPDHALEVKEEMCAKGVELIQREVTDKIRFTEEMIYGKRKKYLIQTCKEGLPVYVHLLSAFACPTYPAMYIYIKERDKKTGNVKLLLLMKDPNVRRKSKDIMGVAIRLVEDITKAFADEIVLVDESSSDNNIGPSMSEINLRMLENDLNNVEIDQSGIDNDQKNLEIDPDDEDSEDETEEIDTGYYEKGSDSASAEYGVSIENSAFDTDELEEDERKLMCQRAVDTIPELNIELSKKKLTVRSYFYVLRISERSNEDDSSGQDEDFVKKTITQAFMCPSNPEIYINIEDNTTGEATMWVIVKKSGWSPPFNIFMYYLKLPVDMIEVPDEKMMRLRQELTEEDFNRRVRRFSEDLVCAEEKERLQICQKSLLATLGTRVELLQNASIDRPTFYEVIVSTTTTEGDIVQSIICPTKNSMFVHVHVVKDEETGKNASWVFLKQIMQIQSSSVE